MSTKFICWTDYPFTELGDAPYVKAPVRQVEVVSYDHNKYCKIWVDGCAHPLEVKAGYLYTAPGRIGEVPQVSTNELEKKVSRTSYE